MMLSKKRAALFAALLLGAAAGVSATGIGPQTDVTPVLVPGTSYPAAGLACSAKFDGMPIYWAFATDVSYYSYIHKQDNGTAETVTVPLVTASVTGDYWIMNKPIKGIWKWYWGMGGALSSGLTTNGKNLYIATGPRAVAGMNWFFCDGFLELFAQGAVQPEIEFVSGEDGSQNGMFRFPVLFPFEAGLRFWF